MNDESTIGIAASHLGNGQSEQMDEKPEVRNGHDPEPDPQQWHEPSGDSIFSWDEGAKLEPWPKAVDGAKLLDELVLVVKRYVVVGNHAPETLALWVVHTYAFQFRDVTTYIGIESPQKRCGKTTLLTLLNELVNRPVVASNISSPALFRVIEEKQPTLMIDEADTVLHQRDELTGILNAGYRRKTAYVVRVAPESRNPNSEAAPSPRNGATSPRSRNSGGMRLARYSSWCPKAIATIQHLPETLADRCIVITMHRKKVSEKCDRVRDLDGGELRRKCERFVRDHAQEIGKARPGIPGELNDRAAEIWEPLFALADLAGEQWPRRAREAAVGLSASGQEETGIGALLFDIWTGFLELKTERMFSRELVKWLNERGDRPWAEMGKAKDISEQWLSRQLRPYGALPKTLWIGERSARGYELADMREAFERYIPKGQARKMIEENARVRRDS